MALMGDAYVVWVGAAVALLAVVAAAVILAVGREGSKDAKPPRPLFDPQRLSLDYTKPSYQLAAPCLVIGWDETLSRPLVDALLQQGYDVTVAHSEDDTTVNASQNDKLRLIKTSDEVSFAKACEGMRTVFFSPSGYKPQTPEIANALTEACSSAGVQVLILAGTSSLRLSQEESPSINADTLSSIEQTILTASSTGHMKTAAIRSHGIFGAADGFVRELLRDTQNNKRYIASEGSGVRAMTFIGNLVHAHLYLAQELGRENSSENGGHAYSLPVSIVDDVPFNSFVQQLAEAFGFHTIATRPSQAWPLEFLRSMMGNSTPKSRYLLKAVEYTTDAKSLSELGFKSPYTLQEAFYSTVTAMSELINPVALKVHSIRRLGRYTRAQVSLHASSRDVWLIVDGRVYDFTDFVEEHPGGEEALLQHAGGDASEGFHGPQHPVTVWDVLPKYLIGDLVD